MNPKVTDIKTIIVEDEITFMQDADVEFVSLVKHGANRTPFRILKSDKGDVKMEKVIVAVLAPKSLTEEALEAVLKDYRTDEVKEYDTFNKYVQVAEDAADLDSAEVIQLDEKQKIFGVIAALKEDAFKDDENKPEAVEKEALDYATMDSLYEELYAMADIVSGSMRQANIEPAGRRKTILTAIDNFRSFAEMLLKTLKDEDVKAVKAEDHPNLVLPVEKQEEAGTCPDCGWTAPLSAKACGSVIHKGCTNPMKCEAAAEEKEEKEDPPPDKEEKVETVEDPPAEDPPADKTDNDPVTKTYTCPTCEAEVSAESAPKCAKCDVDMAEKAEDPPEDPPEEKVEFDADAFKTDLQSAILKDVTDVVSGVVKPLKDEIKSLGEKIGGLESEVNMVKAEAETAAKSDSVTNLEGSLTEIKDSVSALSSDVDKLKHTPKASSSSLKEDPPDNKAKKEGSFKGSFLARSK